MATLTMGKGKIGTVSLRKNRNFLFLLLSTAFSTPGYYVYLLGCAWIMLTLNENYIYFGMLFLAASLPRLLCLISGELLTNSFRKRTVLFLSNLSRALLIGLLLLFLWMDSISGIHLIILSTLFGISDALSYPACTSLASMLLGEKQFQRGNTILRKTEKISPLLGLILGGGWIVLAGPIGIFIVTMVMLLLSSGVVWFIHVKATSKTVEKVPFNDGLKEGFQYAQKSELMISVRIVTFVLNFFFADPYVDRGKYYTKHNFYIHRLF